MGRPASWFAAGIAIVVLGVSARPVPARESGPVDLLRLASAKVEDASLTEADRGALRALTDGDPATAATLAATPAAPLVVVWSFGGATVAPEKVVVQLPAKPPADAIAARVEVLVSVLSPTSGLQSLRGDPLKPGDKPQGFEFPAAAARWIVVRVTPAAGSVGVALASLSVLGREGAPATVYAFAEAPAKAFDVLARLKALASLDVVVAPDEASLFEDARDGRLDTWSFADASLLSCGVLDPAKRKAYAARLDRLTEEARTATAAAKTPFEKGEALLRWLHAGPMAKGYVADQTDLSVVLDTGTFNCVSSATLYDVIGRRLGLDLRAIEVPTHAFAVLYDGADHADVETTTKDGFNPARDKAVQEQFEKQTGFRYIQDKYRDQRREIGEAGLVAITYYNHGVLLVGAKRWADALLQTFRAMSLDAECASAVKNALSILANWSVSLSKGGKFEEALTVLGVGIDLAPKDALLRNNRVAVYTAWAEAAMDAGRAEEAVAIVRKAQTAVPDGPFGGMESWLYAKRGEQRVRAGDFEGALAVTQPGLEVLTGGARDELVAWRGGLWMRWAAAERKAGRFEEALGVLERGRAAAPADARIPHDLGYTAQEYLRSVVGASGAAAGEATLAKLLTRFPDVPEVRKAGVFVLQRAVQDLLKAKKEEEALALIERQTGAGLEVADARSLATAAYDAWAIRLTKALDGPGATDVYAKALAKYPGDGHLTRNAAATWDQWGRTFVKAKDWAGAVDVYRRAVAALPGQTALARQLKYCEQQQAGGK